jgi:serine/threonine protein kinase/transposase
MELIQKIKESGKYCRDESLLKKLDLFLKAHQAGNILKACREAGKGTSYYYFWWNRYRKADFSIEALKEVSRRPKRSPRSIHSKVVEWIRHYRREFRYGPEKIQLYLERDHGLRVSKSTVYRVILREKLPLRKRKAVPSHKKRSAPVQMLGNRYLLEEELGRGGTGVVYRAKDLKSGEKVALKRVPLRTVKGLGLSSTLKNEFSTLISLRHPHLARVLDFGTTERELYFTSELLEGGDFFQTALEADLNTVFQLILQILRGLDFLHRRGVLHLDLKPENIRVTDPGKTGSLTVKLIDFGSAQWKKKGVLASGEFSGTPPYAAPEILQERPPSPASDLYSLGILLCRLFGGRFPFRAQDPVEILKEQVYADPLRMEDLHPGLPEDFADLLLKMVAKDPAERFASARQVLDAFNGCLGENFSLRSSVAPVNFLEESDYGFRCRLQEELTGTLLEGSPQVILVSGPRGSGKSRLIETIKAALQIRGRAPLLLKDAVLLDEMINNEGAARPSSLLLDFKDEPSVDWILVLNRLENLRLPVLAVTERSRSVELNPSRWIDLERLSPEETLEFLRQEIAEFPTETWWHSLINLSKGSPEELNRLLQALREEGIIQWTSVGWRWTEMEIPPDQLRPRQEARWEERRRRVGNVLNFFPAGMTAETLNGLLDLEAGSLDGKLAEWVEGGFLTKRRMQKVDYYSVLAPSSEEKRPSAPRDWAWMEKELEVLYEKGEFQAGVRWADLLFSTTEKIPASLRILFARHTIAAGAAEKALQWLPPSPPEDLNLNALFHEITTRAFLLLGRRDEIESPLRRAEDSYMKAGDKEGLSRLFNLRGSHFKIRGEFGPAEHFFQESVRYAAEARESYLQGLAQMNLATLYHDQGDYSRAERAYQEAFRLEKESAHPSLACRLRHNWVNLLFHVGRPQEAEEVCYDWLKLALQYRYADQQAAAFNYLALIAGQQNRRELQKNHLSQALNLLNPSQFPQLYFQSLMNRASVNLDLRKFTAAELDAGGALKIAETNLGPSFSALAHLLLGRIYRDRPRADLDLATKSLNIAHEIIWKNQYRQLLWEVEFERGLNAKKKKETERARNYFLAAKNYLESFLHSLPETLRQGYLRDRRWERIEEELTTLKDEVPKIED